MRRGGCEPWEYFYASERSENNYTPDAPPTERGKDATGEEAER